MNDNKPYWLEPWYPLGDEGKGLENELYKEVQPGHILYGFKVKAIARRFNCDDVLYTIIDQPGKYAYVHLTYARNITPDWPEAIIYESWEDWEKHMQTDHKS